MCVTSVVGLGNNTTNDQVSLLHVSTGFRAEAVSQTVMSMTEAAAAVFSEISALCDFVVRGMQSTKVSTPRMKRSPLWTTISKTDPPAEFEPSSPGIGYSVAVFDLLGLLIKAVMPAYACSPLFFLLWWVSGMAVLTNTALGSDPENNEVFLSWHDAMHMLTQIATTVGYGSNVDMMAKKYPDASLKMFHGAHGFAGLLGGVGDIMNAVADLTLKVMEKPISMALKTEDPDYKEVAEECTSESCQYQRRAILKGRMFKRGLTLINVFLLCSVWLFIDLFSNGMKDADPVEILGRTWYILIITMTSVGYGDFAPGTMLGTATTPLMLPLLLESYAKFTGSVSELNYVDITEPIQKMSYEAASGKYEDELDLKKDFTEMFNNNFLLGNCPLYDKAMSKFHTKVEKNNANPNIIKEDSEDDCPFNDEFCAQVY
jgi:hypothetical protein